MVKFTQVRSKIIYFQVSVRLSGQTASVMRETSKTVILKVMAHITALMENVTKVSGWIASDTGKVRCIIQTEIALRAHSRMARNTVTAFTRRAKGR